MRIIGSIDNAVMWSATYHLIFIDGEMLKFKVMGTEERVLDIWNTQMTNANRIIPVEGQISNYNMTKEEVEKIIQENLIRGKEIEENLDKILEDKPDYLEEIPYSSINSVILTNGSLITLPHVEFRCANRHLKFHLAHDNYHGRGKLEKDVFTNYTNTLRESFGDLLYVKGS
ncbi:hypothetical protein ACNF40_00565 [Cuniculiplasma sp. SKW4]|uniref:hypothetical protein n=1 Tax=Cuniculiplasma sp. SKW4 TaxID=3400171 RepID=UPI003FD1FE66